MTRRPQRDVGLTLTELLIVVALMGLVVVALTGAMMLFLRTQGDAGERVDTTRGLQQLVNYFPADVASAQRIEFAAPWTSPCLVLGEPKLNLVWSESFPGTETETVSVTYTVSSDGSTLVRALCDGDAPESFIVARNVSGVTAAPGGSVAGQVDLSLEFDEASHTISGSSRNR